MIYFHHCISKPLQFKSRKEKKWCGRKKRPDFTLTQGRMWVMMICSRLSSGRFSQNSDQSGESTQSKIGPQLTPSLAQFEKIMHKCSCLSVCWPLTLLAAAARTSASQSFRRFWNAGTRSFLVISGPTAFWSWSKRRSTSMHRMDFCIYYNLNPHYWCFLQYQIQWISTKTGPGTSTQKILTNVKT